MSLTAAKFEKFTAFQNLEIKFSPGVNVLVGANGTGKTHIMKAAYAACDVTRTGDNFAEKLVRVFLPSGNSLGRLVKRQSGSSACSVKISRKAYRAESSLRVSFSNHATAPEAKSVKLAGVRKWNAKPVNSVFIPVKEMLSNAPGFQALYAQRELHFEAVYDDILARAYLPPLRGKPDRTRRKLLSILQNIMEGKVTTKEAEFFLRNKQGNLEFSLLAEGMRKLGLLWLLIQNGTLSNGSVLFWDEPETNLNPSLFGELLKILLELQRTGVQIFLATHDYCILKELDLQKKRTDKVVFHSLFRENGNIAWRKTDSYLNIHPNAIADAFDSIYDREIKRSITARGGK